MPSKVDVTGPQQELRDAIASKQLSEPLQKQANDILDRIERPVRVGVMGLPGSGKSTLLNLLLGSEALPEGVRLPTMNLTYGPEPIAICTLSDGSKQTIDCTDMSAVTDLSPVFVEATLPLPALQKLSMMEIVAGANQTELQRAVQWAAKRIDIALWCSSGSFGPEEQAIWSYVPEKIQDHSFLMLTMADTPEGNVNHAHRVAEANKSGEDYFNNILPIGTKTAIAARKPDGSVDKDALRQSGGMALISAILRDVETGRQAAIDHAHVFLRQIDFQSTAQKAPAPTEAPKAKKEPVVKAAPVEPKPEPDEADTPKVTKLASSSRPVIEQAVDQLTQEGKVMLDALSGGDLDEATIVDTCVDTVTWLAEYLSEDSEQDDPIFSQNRDAAVDAADLIELIRLEPGSSVASDALSVMVQLKQDMQMSLAA